MHTSSQGKLSEQARAVSILVAWMAFSSFFVLLMKQTLSSSGFPYPLALTSFHMASCWAAFGSVHRFGSVALRKRLMPDVDMAIGSDDYWRAVVPIAILNAAGLALGNLAVRVASVAFLQMIKPANLVWGSVFAFVMGVELATLTHCIVVIVVVSGVTIASNSNAEFNVAGFLLQLLATASEGGKLVLVQNVTSKRLKLDPLTTVYKYAPIACLLLACLSCILEGRELLHAFVQSWKLVFMNCMAAVILNVLIVGAIANTSAVVFILAGVVKDIATIGASIFLFGSVVGPSQVIGFALSLAGILLYKVYKQNLKAFLDHGFVAASRQILGSWMEMKNQKSLAVDYEMRKVSREEACDNAGHNAKV